VTAPYFSRVSLPHPRIDPPHRILLIQKGALGDVTLTTALLDDLHRAFPAAAIGFGVGRAAAPLLEHHPLIAERVIIDEHSALGLAPSIRRRRYDWVVDAQSSPRTAILTRVSGARVRIGWRQRVWGAAYTHAVDRVRQAEYVVRARRRLLEAAGLRVGESAPHLELTPAERAEGDRALTAAGAPAGRPRAGLLLGTTELAKNWPLAHFAALVPLLRAAGITPVVFDAPGDDERIARLRALAPEAIIVPRLALRGFLGALAACRVFVSGDTGPAHMADALGVPRVTVFGATPPLAWVPERDTVVALAGSKPPLRDRRERARAAGPAEDYSADVSPARVLAAVQGLPK
jgi:ADP-heptose:LPS heptosyltransferase